MNRNSLIYILVYAALTQCCSGFASPSSDAKKAIKANAEYDTSDEGKNIVEDTMEVNHEHDEAHKDIDDDKLKRQQRRLATMQSWRKTFEEIRALTVLPQTKNLKSSKTATTVETNTTITSTKSLKAASSSMLGKWKLRDNFQTRRFDGFADWENKLQRWTDRASDYFQYDNYSNSTSSSSTLKSALPARPARNNHQHQQKSKRAASTVLDQVSFPVDFKPAPAKPNEPVLPHTDIADKSKNIWIITTAALPWMTGTAVNPILRAAYMLKGRKEAGGSVTLMIPWMDTPEELIKVYGKDNAKFKTSAEQEVVIREWLRSTADMPDAAENLNIQWYPAWFNALENSVYSKGDITALIPENEVDICVLEEPEHLNWYREAGESWTAKFKHVVGIVHTNYFVYAQEQPAALIRAPGMKLLCAWMIRAHCHRVIKLSGTLGTFAPEKELIENVHGVRKSFLDAGEMVRTQRLPNKDDPVFSANATPTVYFLGKMLWSKGLASLMELLKYAEESADLKVKIDMYGGGPDKDAAALKSTKLKLDMPFHGPIDHAALADTHKIFINPSTSEVLCTAVAEALAMGKFVVLPSHPSNDFFAQFPNCLPYATKEEFVGNLYYAMTHAPEPLSEEFAYALSWEAATERFEAAGAISVAEVEAYDQAVNASIADSEINLPPLIENEDRRRKVTAGLRLTRSRFRQFRAKLSEEIQQSKVFPESIEQRIVSELDKRLDLDLDEIVSSPKLRLKLSPAELDAQLLDLYNSLSQGPGGEAIRSTFGGEYVKKQNLRTQKKQQNISPKILKNPKPVFAPDSDFLEDWANENAFAPEDWVKTTLRRNFPGSYDKFAGDVSPSELDSTNGGTNGSSKNDGSHESKISANPSSSQSKTRLDALMPYSCRYRDVHEDSSLGFNAGRRILGRPSLVHTAILRPMPSHLKIKHR